MPCNNARDYPCGLEKDVKEQEQYLKMFIKATVENADDLEKRVYKLEDKRKMYSKRQLELSKRVSELEKVVMECVVRIEAQDRAWEKAVRKLNGEPYV